MMRINKLLSPVVFLAALALAACGSTSTRSSLDSDGSELRNEQGWLKPSPSLAQTIEIRANEAEFLLNRDGFVELTEWFYRIGEPAYPTLIDMSASQSVKTREVAMAVIARLRDQRLLKPFRRRVPEPAATDRGARAAWARALLGMNDLAGAPILIDTMETHEDPSIRKLAHNELVRHVSDNGIEYNAYGTVEERAQGIAAWREWYSRTRTGSATTGETSAL